MAQQPYNGGNKQIWNAKVLNPPFDVLNVLLVGQMNLYCYQKHVTVEKKQENKINVNLKKN